MLATSPNNIPQWPLDPRTAALLEWVMNMHDSIADNCPDSFSNKEDILIRLAVGCRQLLFHGATLQ
jgi:hypothetical protein